MVADPTTDARRAARKALLAMRRRGETISSSEPTFGLEMTDSPFSGGSGDDVSVVSVGSDQYRSVKTISPAEQEKLDERARKLAARKVRNRLSAEASRKRVRDEMEQLSARCEFLQDQVSALQDKLSKYEDVGDVDVTKRKRKDNSGGGLRELNSYIEPAAFIEQPCTYRMALFAGV